MSVVRVHAEPLVTDITASDQCDSLVQFCVTRFGKVDIAVCNARIGIHAPATTMLDEDWAQVMAVSLSGYFNVARSAGRQMIAHKGGSIIAVSANSSEVGYAELTAIASAKGGVDQMCRNLAVEWGPYAIRVNSINPGLQSTFLQPVKWRQGWPLTMTKTFAP
ncbi:SDR family oxidoreductase [Mesorhizobium sp. M1300]|uniref:SDR family NAD(P)-dependent oxidoreductase n=1 Tax=Mesorhizobium sp. M1300 TaxID=2957077 RepID=UPI00333CBD8B